MAAICGVLRKSLGKESVLFWRGCKGSIWQSFPFACESEHALCYNSLNIPQAVDRGIKFSIPKVTFSRNWREEWASFHCCTAALIELKRCLLASSFPSVLELHTPAMDFCTTHSTAAY